jgi:hypothetical protein
VSETVSIFLWALALIAVYVLTRRINIWRMGRAGHTLIKELEDKEAFDPITAVALKDAQRNLLRAGLRNFRPEGLKMLLAHDVVGITHDGKYYLKGKRRAGKSD